MTSEPLQTRVAGVLDFGQPHQPAKAFKLPSGAMKEGGNFSFEVLLTKEAGDRLRNELLAGMPAGQYAHAARAAAIGAKVRVLGTPNVKGEVPGRQRKLIEAGFAYRLRLSSSFKIDAYDGATGRELTKDEPISQGSRVVVALNAKGYVEAQGTLHTQIYPRGVLVRPDPIVALPKADPVALFGDAWTPADPDVANAAAALFGDAM